MVVLIVIAAVFNSYVFYTRGGTAATITGALSLAVIGSIYWVVEKLNRPKP